MKQSDTRIVFGLGHPAHYNLFRTVFSRLREQNISFRIVINDKDVLSKLIQAENYQYLRLSSKKSSRSLFGKIKNMVRATVQLYQDYNRYKPSLYLGCINEIGYVGFLRRVPAFFFDEDDFRVSWLQAITLFPVVTYIFAPAVTDLGLFNYKKIAYNSYHELAYLHPNHFVHDKEIIARYIDPDQPYFLLRVVQLNAYHDIGKKGMSDEVALKIVELLQPHGQVIISSEGALSSALEPYRTKVRPEDMLHLLAGARIFIGDSQTMAAEAGVLGTPFIRYNDFVGKIAYLEELENKYQLGYGIKTAREVSMIEALETLLMNEQLLEEWQEKRKSLLLEKADLSKLITWFILKYPESLKRIQSRHMMVDETMINDIQ